MFFTEKNINIDKIISAIENHSNYKLPYMPNYYLKWEYEYNIIEKFKNSAYGILSDKKWLILSAITILIDLIIYIHFAIIYIDSYKRTNEIVLRIIYVLPVLMFFAIIPLFIGCDIKRWLDTAIISQFAILIIFIGLKDKNILSSIEKIYLSRDKLYFYILIIVFLISCSNNRELGYSGMVAKVLSFAKKIIAHNR